MRTTHHAAALVALFSGTLVAAACIQSPKPEADGVDGSAPGIEIEEDDAVPQGLALELCIVAGKADLEARRSFCNSAWVAPEQKRSCWSKLLLSRAEWIGWCYWNFR